MNKQNRKKLTGMQLFNLISLLVTGGLLLGVVVGNKGVDGLLSRWGSLNPKWMIAAIACMLGYWLCEGTALHLLIGCLYRGVPFRSNMRTAMIGQLYSALTPFSSGGQPIQLLYMQRDGLDTGGGASVLTIKSILYQVGVMLMALVPLVTSYHFFRENVPAFGLLAILGFIVNLLVTTGMLLLALSPRVTRKLYRFILKILHFFHLVRDVDASMAKAEAQFEIYHASTLRYEKKRSKLWWCVVITILQLLMLYLVPYAIYRAFGYNEPRVALHIVAAVAFVSMVSAFIPLPGGSGGAEGSFLLFFALFIPQSDLLLALLLWRLVTYYSSMLVGSIVVMVTRKRQRAVIRLPND